MINRDPKGHFIGQCAAMPAWLPKMLGWIYPNPLEEMLMVAARWCGYKAAEEYKNAARALTSSSEDHDWAERYAKTRSTYATRWFERKTVLLAARAKLETLR